jgi:hypothetical protein
MCSLGWKIKQMNGREGSKEKKWVDRVCVGKAITSLMVPSTANKLRLLI